MKKTVSLVFCFGSILCWSISPILIRFVKDFYSVSFQNFFRFSVSIIILWIFTLVTIGRKETLNYLKCINRPIVKLILIAACNFLHQFFLIKGVYLLLPGLVTIIEESTIIFAAVLASIFLPLERKLITHPIFMAGMFLSVIGVLLTTLPEIVASRNLNVIGSSGPGVLFVFISSLAWALFSLMIKLWLPETPAAVTSSLVFTLVIPFFLISILVSGSPGVLQPDVPLSVWLILAISGVIGVGLGYSFYYQSIKGLGVTMTSGLSLLIPVFTAVISFFVFGETFKSVQLLGTAILLTGCYLLIRTR